MIIVFNPVAGRRHAHLLWRVLDVLVANGIRLDLAETHRAGHAEALAREAARRGAQMVVAAGGDGTIAEVANGLMGTPARLGVIPLGTANVLAHELGLPFAPKSVAAALAFGRTRTLWPGQANGPDGARLFVQMLGVGFDAHVVHNLPFPLKRIFGKGAYVMQSMRELMRYKFPSIRLRIDDAETEAASVIISKGRLYGGRFRLAADAVPSDPGFSVVLFDRTGAMAAMMYGAALPLNLLGRAPGVRHVRARRIDFLQNTVVPAQTDGDRAGWAPLWVGDAPGPIQVVMG
ncbi:diacylglycerol/lipid kinase family protein [Rhodopila sp.]|uniref:diacylglycerol/lipid kinase family protein n=1 Tax=Rhodopila sp. TaxID=2480087 RepID=UPI003D0C893E